MTENRTSTISLIFDAFPAAFVRDRDASIKTYAAITSDIPAKTLRRAVMDLIATSDKLPTVAEIRRVAAAVERAGGRSTIEERKFKSKKYKAAQALNEQVKKYEREFDAWCAAEMLRQNVATPDDLDITSAPDWIYKVYEEFEKAYPIEAAA